MPLPDKILVLSLTRMGDIIQSIPFFRRLRLRQPDAEIHVLVEQCFADVVNFLSGVDRVHSVRLEDLLPALASDKSSDLPRATSFYADFVGGLRREGFTEVWNLTHTRPSMVLNFLLAGEGGKGVTLHRDGLQRVNAKWLTYFFATNLARPWCQFNLVDIYANCVDGVEWGAGRDLNIGIVRPFVHSEVARIAIHAGASQKAKQWPVESYREVAQQLSAHRNVEILLIGGRYDARLARAFDGIPSVRDLLGKTTVPELAEELSQCHLLLSNDSGPMHIAAAVGTPVLDITVGSALGSETAPYGEGHLVVEPNSACFPCDAKSDCALQSCASRIRPEAVTALAEWKLGWSKAPDASNMAGSRVYRTSFSAQDGMLELKRLFSNASDPRDDLNAIARPAWLAALSPEAALMKQSEGHVSPELANAAGKAATLTLSVESLARRLAQTARRNPRAIREISGTAAQLQSEENVLRTALSRHGLLSSFLRYADIARGSIADASLANQAEETAAIYRTLHRLLAALSVTVSDAETNVSNINLSFENAYENHTERS